MVWLTCRLGLGFQWRELEVQHLRTNAVYAFTIFGVGLLNDDGWPFLSHLSLISPKLSPSQKNFSQLLP